jgi:predicted nucleic-acid-binding Zn-ribbon protein
MKNKICIKCEGHNVRKLNTYDGNDGASRNLSLVHYKNPNAMLFKGRTYYPMYAIACFDCGYVEFYLNIVDGKVDEREGLTGDYSNPIVL